MIESFFFEESNEGAKKAHLNISLLQRDYKIEQATIRLVIRIQR
jgi:hypothetical protein